MSMSEFVGRTLGQYRIESPVDAGGMGQVFRGIHIYLDRPAAIKVMHPHIAANPSFRERFLTEAKSVAALQDQHIVAIYEFGEQDGQLYLVMELVPDGSLRSLLHRRSNQQGWPLSLGLNLVRQAAEGLAAAHAQQIIHRDIKPDNMLLLRQNAPGTLPERYQLKISDFGIARLAEGSGLTATGSPLGTLAYMSPEQCTGAKVDGRSDLYSLGVVLYEVATGYLPFQIENFVDALRKHTQVEPPPPRQVRPDLPIAVEEIILRCLAKRPEDRYQSGMEIARALQAATGETSAPGIALATPAPIPQGETVVSPPSQGNTPAPLVATLQGYSAAPRVRVLDQAGQTLQVAEVTTQGITVGRHVSNTISLPSTDLSRQHLQVQWNGSQVTLKDLQSSNGTMLENRRLQAQVSYPWQEREVVRIGPYWLRLEGATAQPATPSLVSPDATTFQAAQTGLAPEPLVRVLGANHPVTPAPLTSTPSGRIGIRVEPPNVTITPGQPTNVRVALTNLGTIVDWLTVTAEGVPPAWVQGPASEVQLNPGMQETVDLGINVARLPENQARDYPIVIRARSREKPSESGTAQGRWTVLPFKDDALRIEPRRVVGRGRATYTVTLANQGNVQARHELRGDDDEQKMSYQFRQEALMLEPGQEARVALKVGGQRRLIGREQAQRFQVHSQINGGKNPLSGNAEFVNQALLPPWVLSLVAALLALSIIGGTAFALLSRPQTPTIITTNPGTTTNGNTQVPQKITTPPPNTIPPMALSPTVVPTVALPPMQPAAAPAAQPATTNIFVQQATTSNTTRNFTVINNTLTNGKPNVGLFVTQNATPNGQQQVLNNHPEGVWFDNSNWGVFNEDDMPMTPQAAFNVWIPKNANASFVQQATTANIVSSSTTIDNPLVNNNPNLILLVTQSWNPGGQGGVFNTHPVGVAFNNGHWSVFNEDGAAMTPQTSFNIHVLTTSSTNFTQQAADNNMSNGALVLKNPLLDNDPKAILLITQLWNPQGGTGVYNNHPVAVAFNGTNWEVVNADQTPIAQGVAFNVVILQH